MERRTDRPRGKLPQEMRDRSRLLEKGTNFGELAIKNKISEEDEILAYLRGEGEGDKYLGMENRRQPERGNEGAVGSIAVE